MRIGIVGDVHWSTYSSIVRSRGKKYSTRLENLISTINFVEETFKQQECDLIVYLGDFFDRPDITAEEASALKEVKWFDSIPHHFIVGNHEANISSLVYNSTNILKKPNFFIEDIVHKTELEDLDIYWLPYIVEDDRKPLIEYLENYNNEKRHVIFSHNDLKGVQYAQFLSVTGFDLTEIDSCCDLFINGHIHNGSYVDTNKKILNLGNITGQNFNEDAFTYPHLFAILNTETLALEFFENLQALNFYKIKIASKRDLEKLNNLKSNVVISINCDEQYADQVKEKLRQSANIMESRIVIYKNEVSEESETVVELAAIDYLKQFSTFIIEHLGSDDIVKEELSEVCR